MASTDFLLSPRAVVDQARTMTRADFVDTMSAPLLVVRIEDPHGELVRALEERDTEEGQRIAPSLGFQTVTEADTGLYADNSGPVSAPLGEAQLRGRLVRGRYHVIPLRKRAAGKTFTDRISVGRARNNDVVLRDESVSKFHAWFECDESGHIIIADARSKNGTCVADVRLRPGAAVRLPDAADVRFGRVDALVLSAARFWTALRGASSSLPPPRR